MKIQIQITTTKTQQNNVNILWGLLYSSWIMPDDLCCCYQWPLTHANRITTCSVWKDFLDLLTDMANSAFLSFYAICICQILDSFIGLAHTLLFVWRHEIYVHKSMVQKLRKYACFTYVWFIKDLQYIPWSDRFKYELRREGYQNALAWKSTII